MSSEQQHGDGQREEEAAGQFEDPRGPDANVVRDVSREMVRLSKTQFGRGRRLSAPITAALT